MNWSYSRRLPHEAADAAVAAVMFLQPAPQATPSGRERSTYGWRAGQRYHRTPSTLTTRTSQIIHPAGPVASALLGHEHRRQRPRAASTRWCWVSTWLAASAMRCSTTTTGLAHHRFHWHVGAAACARLLKPRSPAGPPWRWVTPHSRAGMREQLAP
jgi:hypothetical protein